MASPVNINPGDLSGLVRDKLGILEREPATPPSPQPVAIGLSDLVADLMKLEQRVYGSGRTAEALLLAAIRPVIARGGPTMLQFVLDVRTLAATATADQP